MNLAVKIILIIIAVWYVGFFGWIWWQFKNATEVDKDDENF